MNHICAAFRTCPGDTGLARWVLGDCAQFKQKKQFWPTHQQACFFTNENHKNTPRPAKYDVYVVSIQTPAHAYYTCEPYLRRCAPFLAPIWIKWGKFGNKFALLHAQNNTQHQTNQVDLTNILSSSKACKMLLVLTAFMAFGRVFDLLSGHSHRNFPPLLVFAKFRRCLPIVSLPSGTACNIAGNQCCNNPDHHTVLLQYCR